MSYALWAAMLWAGAGGVQGLPEPLEIKGIRIGMSEQDVRGAWKREACQDSRDPAMGDRICFIQRPTFAGVPATGINVGIYDDRVESVYVGGVSADDFDEVLSALIAKYGPPSEDVPSVVENRMGTEFDNRTVRWIDAQGTTMQAVKRGGSVDSSSVMLLSAGLESMHEARSKRKAEEAADDL